MKYVLNVRAVPGGISYSRVFFQPKNRSLTVQNFKISYQNLSRDAFRLTNLLMEWHLCKSSHV
jgi:hypothetical protein